MDTATIKAMMGEVAIVVREATAAAVAPLNERIAGLEAQLKAVPPPFDPEPMLAGLEASLAGVAEAASKAALATVEDEVRRVVDDIPPPKDGQSVTPEDVAPMIREIIVAEVSALPLQKGDDGRDGADATDEMIARAVSEYLTANPPRDGIDGKAGQDGEDGQHGRDGVDGKDGENGKDGAGLADALIDHEGTLVLTFTDGTVKSLAKVVGRDGLDGKDGKDGEAGPIGLGFDDLDLSLHEDGRTVLMSFERGDTKQTFELGFPVVLDRGVFKDGEAYEKGDAVTWAGSLWIAQEPTTEKPETGKGWRLAVKRGRDGTDAK
jgi:hypothetical protein